MLATSNNVSSHLPGTEWTGPGEDLSEICFDLSEVVSVMIILSK